LDYLQDFVYCEVMTKFWWSTGALRVAQWPISYFGGFGSRYKNFGQLFEIMDI